MILQLKPFLIKWRSVLILAGLCLALAMPLTNSEVLGKANGEVTAVQGSGHTKPPNKRKRPRRLIRKAKSNPTKPPSQPKK